MARDGSVPEKPGEESMVKRLHLVLGTNQEDLRARCSECKAVAVMGTLGRNGLVNVLGSTSERRCTR